MSRTPQPSACPLTCGNMPTSSVNRELLTNAVKESRSLDYISPVRLWLLSDRVRILILVRDASPQSPERVNASEEAEYGRGLHLVEVLSAQWSWYVPAEIGGKVVSALVTEDSDS